MGIQLIELLQDILIDQHTYCGNLKLEMLNLHCIDIRQSPCFILLDFCKST